MPNTRKKVIKTVYHDEDDSEAEKNAGDYSDSGSEAEIFEESDTDDEEIESDASSVQEFNLKIKKPCFKPIIRRKKFAKEFIGQINKQNMSGAIEDDEVDVAQTLFSVKDLTDADKLLPSVLNLSESDSSSEDESPKQPKKRQNIPILSHADSDNDTETKHEYKNVFSELPDNSEEIAKKTFQELEQHKSKIEQTKAAVMSYTSKTKASVSNVQDLLALGEEVLSPSPTPIKKEKRGKKPQQDSESEIEDWEEVNESKGIPQQGLQLVVGIPDACRKKKTIDIEMMMKRKINRVKKEHQVFMHKVHVLCWIGHGNHVSRVLNDQEILAAALSLVPSKECYPGERVDMKYVQQITTWYKDKFILKYDKNEDKFRPKAPPLKAMLLDQIKQRLVKSEKYLVFIFVSMLRALGLQCRVMFNFVTLPLKPPHSELCSLSSKPKEDKNKTSSSQEKPFNKSCNSKSNKSKSKQKIPQVDGVYDYSSSSDSDFDNILQLDGSNDTLTIKTRRTRANKLANEDDASPPKRPRASSGPKPSEPTEQSAKKVIPPKRTRKTASLKTDSLPKPNNNVETSNLSENDEIFPSKRVKKSPSPRNTKSMKADEKDQNNKATEQLNVSAHKKARSLRSRIATNIEESNNSTEIIEKQKISRGKKRQDEIVEIDASSIKDISVKEQLPKIKVTQSRNSKKQIIGEKDQSNLSEPISDQTSTKGRKVANANKNDTSHLNVPGKTTKSNTSKLKKDEVSKYFDGENSTKKGKRLSLNKTTTPSSNKKENKEDSLKPKKLRTLSAPEDSTEKSKYFESKNETKNPKSPAAKRVSRQTQMKEEVLEDAQRVSHRDLAGKSGTKNDVTDDLVNIIKKRVKEAKENYKKRIVKGKIKQESDEDSDYLPVEGPTRRNSESDDDFKPTKISPKNPKPSTSRKIDRRVLSSDDDLFKNKSDVWCEIYVEELEQWIAVDVVRGKAHCTNEIYNKATHPVCYVVGWDNNNKLKDLTRRYVPQWNTVTRKQRAEPSWWEEAIQLWLGLRTARDKEEDDQLSRMQLEAPLPKSIAEYKNHPLYALKRHLLKFEALYPPDAATLGFVRNEAVYSRDCVYVCRSRDTWLKEAKVVRPREQPYKVVKARPKWDKLSNKLITDKPLEVFGPWQVQDYEPPVAENGIVPRNAYGNVELFKDCMLPKGTVHIKLPGLNRVAKKLNIDCAPAMTGFDFNGGWSHPVYDGFVVCKEFEEIITAAWVKDQEDIERREREKIEARVYGNWRRLIKGLLIRERLKDKYGFEEPSNSQSQDKKKNKGPRLVVKKNM